MGLTVYCLGEKNKTQQDRLVSHHPPACCCLFPLVDSFSCLCTVRTKRLRNVWEASCCKIKKTWHRHCNGKWARCFALLFVFVSLQNTHWCIIQNLPSSLLASRQKGETRGSSCKFLSAIPLAICHTSRGSDRSNQANTAEYPHQRQLTLCSSYLGSIDYSTYSLKMKLLYLYTILCLRF